jgi:hypothetical protein
MRTLRVSTEWVGAVLALGLLADVTAEGFALDELEAKLKGQTKP